MNIKSGNIGFQAGTRFCVADNSGIIKAECIKILGNKTIGQVNDIIVASVKQVLPNMRSQYFKSVVRMLIVRTAGRFRTIDGGAISFYGDDANAAVLINANNELIGTRVFGPIPSMLNNAKILSLAKQVVL
jgi:large subunit ribosomal protein L14